MASKGVKKKKRNCLLQNAVLYAFAFLSTKQRTSMRRIFLLSFFKIIARLSWSSADVTRCGYTFDVFRYNYLGLAEDDEADLLHVKIET